MDFGKFLQIKRRIRIGGTFTCDEVGQLIDIIQQHRKFIDHLLAYSTNGHTSMFNNLYDVRSEAVRLKGLIERKEG